MAIDKKYYVDGDGKWLGAFVTHDDEEAPIDAPSGATEVPSAPDDARAVWNGSAWDYSGIEAPKSAEERVLDALKKAGVITDEQATAALAVL